jgi:hypothetical protein
MAKKIYVAGPMRGIKYFNFPSFDMAKRKLTIEGWEVVSPADLDRETGFDPRSLPDEWDWNKTPETFSLQDAIERDLKAIAECEAMYMLDGWQDSKGAIAEKTVAEWHEHEILYQTAPALAVAVKDGDTIANEAGGKQSFIAARFDCIPPEVLRLLAQCLGFGARKYGKENWRNIPIEDNLAHAMNHLNEWNRGDRSEPHLVNALARTTFALSQAVHSGDQDSTYVHPEMCQSQ